jgi:hypothetical protein
MRVKLKPLASKHRIAHLAALIRLERKGSARAVQLTALLRQLSAATVRNGRA